MPDEEFSPIDALREQAAVAAATPPNAPEYGLDTRSLPVTSKDEVAVRLRGPSLRLPASPAAILADIGVLEANLPIDDWRRFRMAAGRALGFVPHREDHDDGAD